MTKAPAAQPAGAAGSPIDLSLPLGFCTSVFGHRLALSGQKLRRLARAGATWAEIAGLQEPHVNAYDDERVEELARAAREAGLAVWSWHASFCGIAMDDADTRADGVRKIVQAARAARRMGARIVVVHPGRDVPSVSRKRELRWTVEALSAVCDQLPAGTKLGLETMGKESLAGPPEEMLWVLDRLAGAPVGVCFDTGHVNQGYNPAQYARLLAGRIVTTHLHDNDGDRDAHAMPGEGNIDWPATLRAIREGGYDGVWMSEGGDEKLTVRQYVREYIRRMKKYCAG